ncbi:TadE/TadG family type IV pilus assembly protein [Pontixanthobacter luteolus]|uniref:TadE/TadG family type IV pilus assembly protein n=1 Tax=Pontixanthobacter luteolus TaxID=295089 RepID=UPI002303F8AC|nr:hypothetical protein [Pontixanthobacter luteolus]
MSTMTSMLRRLKGDTAAVAMTEFALAAPMMLTAGLWGLETANLAVTHMQISQTAMHIADNASRIGDTSTLTDRKIYETDLNDLLLGSNIQAGEAIDLYEFGRVIISSLEVDPDDPTGTQQYIHWQRCKGRMNVNSGYGDEGTGKGDPSFTGMGPAGQEVIAMEGEAVVFVEVFYEYQPLVTDAFISDRLIKVHSAFNVRDSRDLTQIYQYDPANPDAASGCDTYDGYKSVPEARSEGGGWEWDFGGGVTSSSSGGSTSTSSGSSTTSGGSTTTSGGSTTTSGGSTTTSGGSTTSSGGSTTGGASSGGGATSGGRPPTR